MEIVKKPRGEALELVLSGRLDAYWSDHLAGSIEESIRLGKHHIQLNLAGVPYLSSAGIRVLLRYFKQLRDIKGSLAVVSPSENAYAILELAGVAATMVKQVSEDLDNSAAEPKRVERDATIYQDYPLAPDARLSYEVFGSPGKLASGYTGDDSRSVSYPESTFGLGIGAFGNNFADCQTRFGEFLAVGGVATYLPTDGTNVPDYMISEGLLVPELEVLYGLRWQGQFSHLIRFDAKPEPPGVASLAELVAFGLDTAASDPTAFVIIAETSSLVGATMKKSPVVENISDSPLSFPAVRDWLSFTAERAFERCLCVAVGVASRKPDSKLDPLLRPLGAGVMGHFHAAVFPYRALQRGNIDLFKTVNALFESESLQTLVHLLADDREIEGVGQSEFLRGACWAGPLIANT